jgi:hypothetical protein
MEFGDLNAMMVELLAAFLDPLRAALGNVDAVARPLAIAVIPVVFTLACFRAAAGSAMPIGAVIETILSCGLALGLLEFWPAFVDANLDQIGVIAGLVSTTHSATDAFELISVGAALATRAFDAAGSALSYLFWPVDAVVFTFAGISIFLAYLFASALIAVAYLECWAAAVLVGPLIGLLGVVGFGTAALVPISFMISSVFRLAALSMIASFGADLIATWALPAGDEELTWLHGFVAGALAIVMAWAAWKLDQLVVGYVLQGRVGFAAQLWSTGRMVGGAVAGMSSGGSGGFSGGAGAGRAASGGAGTAAAGGGTVQATNRPVNARARP